MNLLDGLLIALGIAGFLFIGFGLILLDQMKPTSYERRIRERKEQAMSSKEISSPATTS